MSEMDIVEIYLAARVQHLAIENVRLGKELEQMAELREALRGLLAAPWRSFACDCGRPREAGPKHVIDCPVREVYDAYVRAKHALGEEP